MCVGSPRPGKGKSPSPTGGVREQAGAAIEATDKQRALGQAVELASDHLGAIDEVVHGDQTGS